MRKYIDLRIEVTWNFTLLSINSLITIRLVPCNFLYQRSPLDFARNIHSNIIIRFESYL